MLSYLRAYLNHLKPSQTVCKDCMDTCQLTGWVPVNWSCTTMVGHGPKVDGNIALVDACHKIIPSHITLLVLCECLRMISGQKYFALAKHTLRIRDVC
jgi:hypothetical protein